jgi:uncharacterized protein
VVAKSLYGVELALEKGGKPNYFSRPDDQMNSLHLAAQEGLTEIEEKLVDAGAAVDAIAAPSKNTALLFAASHGNIGVVKYLIDKKANVSVKNGYGNTSLHEAARLCPECCTLLLEAGAAVNEKNNKGSTSLHFAAYLEEDEEPAADTLSTNIATVLIANGADVNAVDTRGMSPLLVCCTTGNIKLLQFLITKGADVKAVDLEQRDAKAIATFYNQTKVIDLLFPQPKKAAAPTQTATAGKAPIRTGAAGAGAGAGAGGSRSKSSSTKGGPSPSPKAGPGAGSTRGKKPSK